jgi:hypothetical protein
MVLLVSRLPKRLELLNHRRCHVKKALDAIEQALVGLFVAASANGLARTRLTLTVIIDYLNERMQLLATVIEHDCSYYVMSANRMVILN